MLLEQITVREIVKTANIHYATFFRHYPTKEALLDDVAADQVDQLVALTLPLLDQSDSHNAVLALCRHVEAHRLLWTTLLTGGAASAMRERLLAISCEVAIELAPEQSRLPLALAVGCAVSLIFETLAWWLAQPPEEVDMLHVADIMRDLLNTLESLQTG